jgi:hypothetical protein
MKQFVCLITLPVLSLVALFVSCHSDPSRDAKRNSVAPEPAVLAPTPSVSSAANAPSIVHRELIGTIGADLEIDMSLDMEGSVGKGTYCYIKKGLPLSLSGGLDTKGIIELKEKDSDGRETGTFRGSFSDKTFLGLWTSPKGGTFPFALKVLPASPFASIRAPISVKRETWLHDNPPGKSRLRYPVVDGPNPGVAEAVNSAIKSLLARLKKDAPEWLEELDYQINYNRYGLLDITFRISGSGAYPSTYFEHRLFDLVTGDELKAKDLFDKSKSAALAKALDARLQKEITAAKSGALFDYPKECSDTAKEWAPNPRFTKAHLNELTVESTGLIFTYPYTFAHAVLYCEPLGTFEMTFADLAPYLASTSALKRIQPDP